MKPTQRFLPIVFLSVVMLGWTEASAQQQATSDFESFRQGLLGDYQSYRKAVKDNYASFLDGVWQEFQAFKAVERDERPKPKQLPQLTPKPVTVENLPKPTLAPPVATVPTRPVPPPVKEPEPPTGPVPVPIVVDEPIAEDVPSDPDTMTVPITVPIAVDEPIAEDVPSEPDTTTIPLVVDEPKEDKNQLSFVYGDWTFRAPLLTVQPMPSASGEACAKAWRAYQQSTAVQTAEALLGLARQMGLNDWFSFQLARSYTQELCKNRPANEQVLLQHFLLVNMGFDIRLARTDRSLCLMVPFDQQLYGRSFLKMDGKSYYLFYEDQTPIENDLRLYSCTLPKDLYCGEFLNLHYNTHAKMTSGHLVKRTISDGHITLETSIDSSLMELFRYYPQTQVPIYAMSQILPQWRQDLLTQIRPQLEGLSEKEAASKLLSFVQNAFAYATDDEQHGYEKPYFIEENFFYPKNDCEDRSVFYAFLVRELLGLDVHLIHYPGHECTAVHFSDETLPGHGYQYEGKRYLICDPTYIGASIGMCMPSFRHTTPEIELWY